MIKPTLLSLLLCLTLLFSCSKKSCFTPPEQIFIRLIDKDGNDLLDPNSANGYKINDISLYYRSNSKKTYSKVTLDSIPNTKKYFLNTDISWNADKGNDFSLQLSPTILDNIFLRYDHISEDNCAFFRFKEFKYNNVVYSNKQIETNFWAFEIIK